jgi:uncharacterized protein (TIGR03083 family)
MADLLPMIRTERLALIDFLETLTPAEWVVPSLCEGWTVQDVAAHLASASAIGVGELVAVSARAGFRPNQVNLENAKRWAQRGPRAIIDQLRVNAEQGRRPLGTTQMMTLVDSLCHADDIRHPLGRLAALDEAAFALVADLLAGQRWPLTIMMRGDARRTVRGLRLVATDLDWTHGDGPEVHGPAEAWLRLLGGRKVDAGELTGPGAATIYERLQPSGT